MNLKCDLLVSSHCFQIQLVLLRHAAKRLRELKEGGNPETEGAEGAEGATGSEGTEWTHPDTAQEAQSTKVTKRRRASKSPADADAEVTTHPLDFRMDTPPAVPGAAVPPFGAAYEPTPETSAGWGSSQRFAVTTFVDEMVNDVFWEQKEERDCTCVIT